MVNRISNGSSLAREAIMAAIRKQAQNADSIQKAAEKIASAQTGEVAPTGRSFSNLLSDGVGAVDSQIKGVEGLPQDLVTGKVEDFHEVAVRLKQADLGFKFALEVRNKLIDAYREVMRMSV